ncbi:class I SAM-dependent methyltransferase [Nocardia sp. NPDC051570]|uniref:class I SAM-dependent methyltransferase n=1 Tax=Nocardia sp. NPDC051570 TaxID=3364324 RepID=UPI003798B39D
MTTPKVLGDVSSEWALGDYHQFAKMALWELGPQLVDACRIGPGMRVLDVGAGTGNVAIPAALAGADVVASDITIENFAVGKAEAAANGVELEWVEADAQHLPFPDSSFDVATSSVGAIFAPRHQDVAAELVRVVKPGGTIGMICWTRRAWICEILATLAHYDPPPSDALPVRLWGNHDWASHVFGDRVSDLRTTTSSFRRSAPSPAEFVAFFEATFGPIPAAFAAVGDQPERAAALHQDLLDLADCLNIGNSGGPAEYLFEYVTLTAMVAV